MNTLELFYRPDEIRRFHKVINRSCVEPCETSAHELDIKIAVVKINLVDIRYLELSSFRRFKALGILNNPVVVEIESRNCIIRLWLLRLLDNSLWLALSVKFNNTEGLRIVNIVTENSCSVLVESGLPEHMTEAAAIENVIAENHRDAVLADELFTDNERLSETLGSLLNGI